MFKEFVDICISIDPTSEHSALRQVEWNLKHTVWCVLRGELENRSHINARLIDLLEICQDRSLKERNPFIELYRGGIFLTHITITETKPIHDVHRFMLKNPFVIYQKFIVEIAQEEQNI